MSDIMFEGLFEFAPDAIVVVDDKGNIIKINTQAEKMFGYNRNEVIGKPVEIFVPESYQEGHIFHRENYMKSPHVRPMGEGLELHGKRKDGSHFPVDITLGPLKTDKGVVVLSIIRDITEHTNMEKKLKASEIKYRSIFENAVEGIFQITIKGNIISANPSLAKMLGYSSQDELIEKVSDFRKLFVEPGCRLEFMHVLKSEGNIKNFESKVYCKDGHNIWILINAHSINDLNGNQIGFEGMAIDITSHKRAEGNFKRLIESGPDAIVVIDEKDNIIITNARTEKMFGYSKDELEGKEYHILMPERFLKIHKKSCKDYFKASNMKAMAIHSSPVALKKNGFEFPVEINMSTIETDEGAIIVIAIRDLTERKN